MGNFLYKIAIRIRIMESGLHSRFLLDKRIETILFYLFLGMFFVGGILFGINQHSRQQDADNLQKQQQELISLKQDALENVIAGKEEAEDKSDTENYAKEENTDEEFYAENGMLAEYTSLYEKNKDVIGWLTIEGTVIDYPVMQTPGEEEYYLRRDFYGNDNQNGSLLMDTESVVGVGRKQTGYEAGNGPSTNLIIHGHTMKTGNMFGTLERYKTKEYGEEHKMICFDSLYEKREYELISVFYSQVYRKKDEVFKYYQFFQADTREEFDDWYKNIKKISLYDTGVSAEFGDEFITLSCCAYPSEDKRFVVVAKRIK